MKELIKRRVLRRLEKLARKTIRTYKPMIIGVAGSVGKTSTKEAIFSVLSTEKTVRKSLKSYNNEFGVPLTVLGIESGFSSAFRWLLSLVQAESVASGNDEDYPEVLVLEMGSDHVGDIERLMTIARPTVGVLTAIAPVHLEFFGSYENVIKEESSIIRFLPDSARAVVNGENKDVLKAVEGQDVRLLSYGFSDACDVWAESISLISDPSLGISCALHAGGERHEIFLPECISKTHVLSCLAAVAVGIHLGIQMESILRGIQAYEPPAGRMRYLPGIKHAHLIDDTYNSSPEAAKSALDVIAQFPNVKKKFAILGDMAELGNKTAALHKEVGAYAKGKIDTLITVGKKAKDIAQGARTAGMKESQVFVFDTAEEAGKFVQERMHEGDGILIKGSQIARLEKVVKEIMAEPLRASELLVRQEPYWM